MLPPFNKLSLLRVIGNIILDALNSISKTAFTVPSIVLETEKKSSGEVSSYNYYYYRYPLKLITDFVEKRNSITPQEIAAAFGLPAEEHNPLSAKEPVIGFKNNGTPVTYTNHFDFLGVLNRNILFSGDARFQRINDAIDLRTSDEAVLVMSDLSNAKEPKRIYTPIEVIKLLQETDVIKAAAQSTKLAENFPGSGLAPNSQGKVFIVVEDLRSKEFSVVKTTIEELKTRKIYGEHPLLDNILPEKGVAK